MQRRSDPSFLKETTMGEDHSLVDGSIIPCACMRRISSCTLSR